MWKHVETTYIPFHVDAQYITVHCRRTSIKHSLHTDTQADAPDMLSSAHLLCWLLPQDPQFPSRPNLNARSIQTFKMTTKRYHQRQARDLTKYKIRTTFAKCEVCFMFMCSLSLSLCLCVYLYLSLSLFVCLPFKISLQFLA